MGKLTVTAFTTLDNVAEEPQLWTGPFFSDATVAFNEQVSGRGGLDAARPGHL